MTNAEAMQPYQRIVQDVRDQIATGRLAAGARIPGIKALAEEYQVAAGTVQRALAELRTLGLIYSHQGRGSFVSEQAAEKTASTAESIRRLEKRIGELTARLERLEQKFD
ncbi:GntR family transcriptional regulator [Streptomyces griseofuscus]|uniref:GntR family transcriptional regulator n=1 Tax=Streptomyces griseofuscus TaxID=146922 RepID=UPI00382661F6